MALVWMLATAISAFLQLKSLFEIAILRRLNNRRRLARLFLFSKPVTVPFKAKRDVIRRKRRYWVKPGRMDLWWRDMMEGRCVPEDWKKNFRMSREQFMMLVDELRPFITLNPRSPRPGISAEKKVCHFISRGDIAEKPTSLKLFHEFSRFWSPEKLVCI